ncbi:MAG: MazG nucleotide pyrophosphohydrolase domain-containing protein [Rhodanobacter sp.]
MHLKEIAEKQHDWLTRMGWTKNTVLEDLALVASEVGEAVNECRGEEPTDALPSELADIVLRTVGLARKRGIDIEAAVLAKMAVNEARGTRGRVK